MKKSIYVLLVLLIVTGCAIEMDRVDKLENLRNDEITKLFPKIYLAAESPLHVDEWGDPINGEYSSEDSESGLHADLIIENGRISEGKVQDQEGNIIFEYSRENGNWVQTIYTNGSTKTMISVTNNDFESVRTEWFNDDGSRWVYSDADSSVIWYKNGQLESKIVNVRGRAEGIRKSWHENGGLASLGYFKDDEMHGTFKKWDENGNLIEEKTYEMGMPEGVHKYWDENGNLIEERIFEDGKPVSMVSEN